MIGDERRDLFVCLPSHTLEHWKLNIHTLQKYLKSNKDDSLHLAWKYTCIFVLGHHCSSELTVFLELHSFRTVYIPEQVMSADKYPCIFSVRIEAIVYITIYNKMNRIYIFITSILKSLVICAIWLAVTGVIYSHIALFYAQNRIFFSASETALLKHINQPSFKAWFKKGQSYWRKMSDNNFLQISTDSKKYIEGLNFAISK